MMFAYRLANEADQAAITNLLEQVSLSQAGLPLPTRQWYFYGAEGMLGTLALEAYPAWGLLRSLAVPPSQQRQGMGAVMVSLAEQEAQRLGLQRLWLLTETASGFFSTLGYQSQNRALAPAGLQTHPQFAALCPQSAVLMSKQLVFP